MIAPRQIGGYIQSNKTAQGFEKMRQRGIPLPPFKLEQNVAKILMIELNKIIADMEKFTVSASLRTGQGIADADPGEELMNLLKKSLSKRLTFPKLKQYLRGQFLEAEYHFFKYLLEDGSEKLKNRVTYALDKDEVFKDRLDGIREKYLDTAMEKIAGGQSSLRKTFIDTLGDWINGERKDLAGLTDIMKNIKKEAGSFSKFFARDQFSRFNRSLMITSYEEAGAKFVKWVTVGDQRVRKEHRDRNGKIYPIDNLPEFGYNCRCGLIPVFKE